MKTMIVDITKCIGCYNCQLACKDEHVGNDWTPYAKSQPEGQFWMKVTELERGTVPKVKVDWIPKMCMHCDDAPCISACIDHAITKRSDGIVLIDPQKCKGSQKCIKACPYGVIYFNSEINIAQKCTMCAHLLDRGWEEPRCVTACPAEALLFGEKEELESLINRAEALSTEENLGSIPKVNVHYIGVPRKFIAGEVFSPVEDKCIDCATITLVNMATSDKFTTKTDNYGDFWLEVIKTGTYSMTIEKEGYGPQEIKQISTEKDVNIGEIKLYKKA